MILAYCNPLSVSSAACLVLFGECQLRYILLNNNYSVVPDLQKPPILGFLSNPTSQSEEA